MRETPATAPGTSEGSTGGPYAGRVARWLSIHDPGGIDTTRALQLAVAFVIVITLGYATSRAFGLGLDVPFPLMAGAGALVLVTFTPAASRRSEARTMGRIFALAMAFLLVLVAVGPGEGPVNEMVQKLLLVPLSFLALVLRRSGMDGQRLGLSLIVVATVGTILAPTRAQAVYFLLAFCQGAAVMVALRLSPWRPSAVQAFVNSAHDVEQMLAAYLREMSEAVRAGRPFPADLGPEVGAARARVWNALANASAEDPGARLDFEHLRAKIYRLRVAVLLLASCIPAGARGGPDWRAPFANAADHIARRLEVLGRIDDKAEERFERAIETLRAAAFDTGLDPASRFALLRAVTAFERLSLVVTGIAAQETAPFPPPHAEDDQPPAPAPVPLLVPGPDGRRVFSAPLKVACQGLVATAITTALDLAFHLEHAYWATMTVMFVLGNSVGETFMRVRYRTVGTLAGVALGMGLFLVLDAHVWLLAALCVFAQMIGIVTQKDRYDVASAATGFSVILGLHLIAGLGPEGMLARVYETVIGAGIALVVSYAVLPVYLTDQFRPEVRALLKRGRDSFASWWPRTQGARISMAPLAREVRQLDLRVPQLGAEQVFGHSAGDVVNIASTLDVLMTYLALLEDVTQRLALAAPQDEVVSLAEAARSRTLNAFAQALGEASADQSAAAAPAVEAAVSMVLALADDPQVEQALPLVADYLAYSDAVLRPLAELRIALSDQAPWNRAAALAAGRGAPQAART